MDRGEAGLAMGAEDDTTTLIRTRYDTEQCRVRSIVSISLYDVVRKIEKKRHVFLVTLLLNF